MKTFLSLKPQVDYRSTSADSITIWGIPNFSPQRLLAIIDVTTNQLIWQATSTNKIKTVVNSIQNVPDFSSYQNNATTKIDSNITYTTDSSNAFWSIGNASLLPTKPEDVTTITFTSNLSTQTGLGTDILQFIYDTDDALSNNELIETMEALRMAIQALTRSGLGQAMPDTSGRLRILLDAITASLTLATITSVGTVTTVSTLSNQTSIGGLAATEQIPSLMRMAGDSLRRNISIT